MILAAINFTLLINGNIIDIYSASNRFAPFLSHQTLATCCDSSHDRNA